MPPDFAVPSLAPTGRLPPNRRRQRHGNSALPHPVLTSTHIQMQRSPTSEKDQVAGTRTSPRTVPKTNTSAPKKSQSIDGARLVSILEKATPQEVTEMLQTTFQQGGKASKLATKASKLLNKQSVWLIAECEKFVSLIADTVPIGEKQWVDVAAQWSRIANENHYPPRSFEQLRDVLEPPLIHGRSKVRVQQVEGSKCQGREL